VTDLDRYQAAVSMARGPRVRYELRIFLPGGGDVVESGNIPAGALADQLRRHARALDQIADEVADVG
jgi:hypothetical protein